MDVKKLRELFCQKLWMEMKLFKRGIIKQNPESIYEAAYQIELMGKIYRVLIGNHELFETEELEKMLVIPDFIELIYQKWLEQDDVILSGLQEFMLGDLLESKKVAA